MKDSDYAVFIEVVESGSFSKAAERLGYTAAGVSYIISELEREIGLPLFNRNHNGVHLNSHGIDFLPEIRLVHEANLLLESKIRSRKEGRTLNIHIGAIDSVASEWLPDAIAEFLEKHPDVRIDVMTGNPYELNDWMENGTIHFMVSEETWVNKNFHLIPIKEDPFFVVLPSGTETKGLTTAELLEGREVMTPFYGGDRTAEVILRRMGIDFDQTYDRVSNIALVKMIARGRGVGILPGLHVQEARIDSLEERFRPEIAKLNPPLSRSIICALRMENNKNKFLIELAACVKRSAAKNNKLEEMI